MIIHNRERGHLLLTLQELLLLLEAFALLDQPLEPLQSDRTLVESLGLLKKIGIFGNFSGTLPFCVRVTEFDMLADSLA